MYAWKKWFEEKQCINEINHIGHAHLFRFTKDVDGIAKMWWKSTSQDESWHGFTVDKQEHGIAILNALPTGNPTPIAFRLLDDTVIDGILDTFSRSFTVEEKQWWQKLKEHSYAYMKSRDELAIPNLWDSSTFTQLYQFQRLSSSSTDTIAVNILEQRFVQRIATTAEINQLVIFHHATAASKWCLGQILKRLEGNKYEVYDYLESADGRWNPGPRRLLPLIIDEKSIILTNITLTITKTIRKNDIKRVNQFFSVGLGAILV